MAPPKRPWFRLYVEVVHDKKLRRQKPETRWLFIACLAAARESSTPGRLMVSDSVPMDWDDLADFAGLTRKQVEAGTDSLMDVGVLGYDEQENAWFVPAWAERQYESDLSTPRVESRRHATSMQRPIEPECNDEATSPENRGQRTETERGEQTGTRQTHALLAPGRPPSLSAEVDELVMALIEVRGVSPVEAAVQQLVDSRRRFQWPSDVRNALEAILGAARSTTVADGPDPARATTHRRGAAGRVQADACRSGSRASARGRTAGEGRSDACRACSEASGLVKPLVYVAGPVTSNPCNDGEAGCHYEQLTLADGTVSPPSPCRNPTCGICR
jgi:hypothetical protein